VGNCQNEGFLPIERVVGLHKGDLQGGRLRTFNVDLGFVDANAIQAGPQQRMRGEKFPPAAAYVGQLDQTLVPVTVFPVVWNQGEDIWRDRVDVGEGVPSAGRGNSDITLRRW